MRRMLWALGCQPLFRTLAEKYHSRGRKICFDFFFPMDQDLESLMSDVDLPKWRRCKCFASGIDESKIERFGRDNNDNLKNCGLLAW